MRPPACRACVLLALVLSLGLHWTVLQSAAWVGMVVSYAKDVSIGEALEKTFDGEHPCPLCKKIEAGVKKERENSKQPKSEATKKIDLMTMAVSEATIPLAIAGSSDYRPLDERAEAGTQVPPVPPPRLV